MGEGPLAALEGVFVDCALFRFCTAVRTYYRFPVFSLFVSWFKQTWAAAFPGLARRASEKWGTASWSLPCVPSRERPGRSAPCQTILDSEVVRDVGWIIEVHEIMMTDRAVHDYVNRNQRGLCP